MTRLRSLTRTSKSVLAAIALAGGLIAGSSANTPAAAETDADFAQYCRATFANSAYQKRAQSWGVQHYCNQGSTLQGIDMAKACEMTTGNRRFRELGDRVLCADGAGPAQPAAESRLSADHFVRYCRSISPNSLYQDIPGNSGGRHHCRLSGGAGGFVLMTIDLAGVCRQLRGDGSYREQGGQVYCTAKSGSQTANRHATAPQPVAAHESGPHRQEQTELEGLWHVTSGILRTGKVRLVSKGNRIEGVLAAYPPAHAQRLAADPAFRLGSVVFVGERRGTRLSGRTVLGVGNPGINPHNRCDHVAAQRKRSIGQWMTIDLTVNHDRIVGRHNGLNFWPNSGGGCRTHPYVDVPGLVQGGWVRFALARADGSAR